MIMGSCCSPVHQVPNQLDDGCQGYHSVYIHPEQALSHTKYNVVYRPPPLNQRLAPGSARPRFWLNPNPETSSPAVVSVAWYEKSPSKHNNLPRLSNTRRSHHVNGKVGMSNELATPEEDHISSADDLHMAGDSDSLVVKAYPTFLVPYICQVLRLRLVFVDPKVEQLVGEYGHLKHGEEQEPMQETAYLVRTMHSLRLQLGYSNTVRGLPEVSVEENHGGVKRLKKVRYRRMPVRWIDLDHRKPSITIVGEAFQLTLTPPPSKLSPEDFTDSNGEIPAAIGTYVRSLDSCPEKKLEFIARLYHWFSKAARPECNSDVIQKEPFLQENILDL